MVWESEGVNAGFSTGKPWLPVPPASRQGRRQAGGQAGQPVRILQAMIAWRKASPALTKGSVRFLPRTATSSPSSARRTARRCSASSTSARWAGFPVPEGVALAEAADLGFASSVVGNMVTLPAESAFIARMA
jgi:Glycosidases